MFASYDLTSFGLNLKNIRESIGYTQLDVQAICGINPDTLRRIENGYTIPKYETLELLSDIYKYDLLNLLRNYRSCEKLYTYYERLDFLISNFDIHILKDLINDFKEFMENEQNNLVNPNIYIQFKFMLEGISKYNSRDNKERLGSLEFFIEALKCSINNFDIGTYANFKYNIFEMRILLLIALNLSCRKKYELSNDYLTFILENTDINPKEDIQTILLNIKIFINLSYNSHRLSNDIYTLDYANKGIDYCVKHNIMFGLYALYYRKGIAEFMLEKDSYMDSLRKSVHILEIQGKFELAELYKKVTKEKYGFSIV